MRFVCKSFFYHKILIGKFWSNVFFWKSFFFCFTSKWERLIFVEKFNCSDLATLSSTLQGRPRTRRCFLIGHRRYDNDRRIHNLDRHILAAQSCHEHGCALVCSICCRSSVWEKGWQLSLLHVFFFFQRFFLDVVFSLRPVRTFGAAVEQCSRWVEEIYSCDSLFVRTVHVVQKRLLSYFENHGE